MTFKIFCFITPRKTEKRQPLPSLLSPIYIQEYFSNLFTMEYIHCVKYLICNFQCIKKLYYVQRKIIRGTGKYPSHTYEYIFFFIVKKHFMRFLPIYALILKSLIYDMIFQEVILYTYIIYTYPYIILHALQGFICAVLFNGVQFFINYYLSANAKHEPQVFFLYCQCQKLYTYLDIINSIFFKTADLFDQQLRMIFSVLH